MGAFSIFKDKNRQKKPAATPTVEDYYLKLSRRLTLAKFICILFIIGFSLFAFSNYPDELSIDNFRYMLKFINLDAGIEKQADKAEVFFDNGKDTKGGMFKGDLAVLNNQGFGVYEFTGNSALKTGFQYHYPALRISEKNILVYDLGGYELRVFNSYSQLFSHTFSYPILGADAADNGGFAVISSSRGYRSGFYVYDEHYRVVYTYFSGDRYIDFIAISPDGTEVSVLLHYAKEGNLYCQFLRFSTEHDEPIFSAEYVNELPLAVKTMADGQVAVLTSAALRFYDHQNAQTGEIFLKEKSLLGYEFGKNYVIISYNPSGLGTVTSLDVYATDGKVVYTDSFTGAILDTETVGERLYVLTHGSLYTVDLAGGEKEFVTVPGEYNLITLDGEEPVLIADSSALYVSRYES